MRNAALEAEQKDISYKDILVKDKKLKKILTEKELDIALEPKNYIGASKKIVAKVFNIINKSKLMK